MLELSAALSTFFDTNQFLPHGHCYLWRSDVLWLNVGSDSLIALAYFAIPGVLVAFVRKRKDLAFHWVFVMFALFILACGASHVLEIWTVWRPDYAVEGLVKLFTACISVATAVALVPMMPRALKLPSPRDLAEKSRELKAANEALQELNASLERRVEEETRSLSRLASIVEFSNEAIIGKDRCGHISEWNPAAERLFGYSADEVLGRSVLLLVPSDGREEELRVLASVARGERVESSDAVRVAKDGHLLEVSRSLSPIKDARGAIVGSSSISRDISARKDMDRQLRKSEARKAAILEASLEAIVTIDAGGKILEWNAAAERTFGYRHAEAVGKDLADLIVPERFRAEHRRGLAQFLATGDGPILGKRIEMPSLVADGFEIALEISVAAITVEGAPPLFTASARDITKSKELGESRQRAVAALHRKNQEMEQFVYTVSHDLKSPLVTSAGFIGLLKEDIAAGNLDSVADSIGRLERANGRMSQLIADLLQLSRVGTIKLEPAAVDVEALVKELCDGLAQQITDMHATVVIEPHMPKVLADRGRVYQALENLIINALKYAVSDHSLEIRVGWEEKPDEVRLYVKDNGPGIAAQYHQRIFGLFQRLERDSRGTGVGLAIVARIMQQHSGRAWVASTPGQGATFWLAFPRNFSPVDGGYDG